MDEYFISICNVLKKEEVVLNKLLDTLSYKSPAVGKTLTNSFI